MPLKTALKNWLMQCAIPAERLVRGAVAASPADLAGMREFLFLQYMMPLGYCVHDTPLYEALRICKPDARITVATRGTGYATLRHNPFIDNLIATADPLRETQKAVKELRAALEQRGLAPACGITNCSNPRTRITLLNVFAGKHVRLGHTLAPALYHLPQTYNKAMSLIDNNLHLLTNFGCPPDHFEPRVFFPEADVEKMRGLLQANGLTQEQPLVIFVTQNSGGQRTGWHGDRFAQVMRHVAQRSQIAFVGTRADQEAIEALRVQAGPLGSSASASFAGLTTISELSALLCLADYVISLDTGTMHIGRAAGTPMVVLGPSWQKPLEWLPLGRERVRILRGQDIDRAPADYQLDEIEPHSVIAAFEELHMLYPPSDLERSARLRKSLSTVDHGAA